MRVLVISQWWRPEPAQLPSSLVDTLAERGHTVEVVTGFPNYPEGQIYPGYRMRWRDVSQAASGRVIRVPLYPSHDSSGIRRALNYVSFGITSSTIGISTSGRHDVAYVYHPPITSAWAARVLRKLRGTPYVLHVQDLWPDAVVESGMAGTGRLGRWLRKRLERMSQRAYDSAAHIVVITPGFRQHLINRGVDPSKVSVIMNWSGDPTPEAPDSALRADLGPPDSRILLFAGNVGRFQNLSLLVRQMGMLPDTSRLHLCVLGEGIDRTALRELASELQLTNVSFLDRCSPQRALEYQQLADACLVSLDDQDFLSATIPGKTQTALALGKPILMVANGDAADLVRKAEAGLAVSPEPEAVRHALMQLGSMSGDELLRLGRNGRDFYASTLDLSVAVQRFEDVMMKVVA